jgi:DNA-binding NarL/FixJ family response regulator
MDLGQAALTERESEVAERIACGMANKEISAALGCSLKTVEFHVTNVLRKAGVSSRLELVCKLLRPGQESARSRPT